MIVTNIVANNTGDHWEKTLNPWMTFILLDNPEIIKPEAKVKLSKNAVNISLRILDISLNYDRLNINPITRKRTPTPIEMNDEISWLRFHVGFLEPSVKNGIVLLVANVPPRIPAKRITIMATKDFPLRFAASL